MMSDLELLTSYLQKQKTIIVDACVAKLKFSESIWSYLRKIIFGRRVKVIVVQEDVLPDSFLANAKKQLPDSSFLELCFIDVLDKYYKSDSVFIFAPEVSKWKMKLFLEYQHFKNETCEMILAKDSSAGETFVARMDDNFVSFHLPKLFEDGNAFENEKMVSGPRDRGEPLFILKKVNQVFDFPSMDELPQNKEKLDIADYKTMFKNQDGSGLIGVRNIFTTKNGEKIILSDNIGKDGGESVVYKVKCEHERSIPMVAKMFRPERLTKNKQRKIERMLEKKIQDPCIAWPLDAVLYKGEIVGYIRNDAGEISLKKYLSQLEQKKCPKMDFISVAIKVCEIVEKVHEYGMVVGDLKPENFFLYLDSSGSADLSTMSIIDTDSFQIENFPMPMVTPPYASPLFYLVQKMMEKKEKRVVEEIFVKPDMDYFALAVLLLQIFIGFFAVPYVLREGEDNADYQKKCNRIAADCFREDKFLFSNVSIEQTAIGVRNPMQQACWSHLPSPIKNAFCRSFNSLKDRKALNPAQWFSLLVRYRWEILHGNLNSLDSLYNVSRMTLETCKKEEFVIPYNKVNVDWGTAFNYDSNNFASCRSDDELEKFKPADATAFDLESLLASLCDKSGFEFKEGEKETAKKSLLETSFARIDIFNVCLTTDIGIALSGKIERI